LERKVHVKQASIERAIFFDVISGQKSKSTQAVLDDDCNEVVTIGTQELSGIEPASTEERITTSV
jgi:hypothetical protein